MGAKLQKVVEVTVKGVEIWFVLGAAGTEEEEILYASQRADRRHLKTARIASLKKGSKVRRCCCISVVVSLDAAFFILSPSVAGVSSHNTRNMCGRNMRKSLQSASSL